MPWVRSKILYTLSRAYHSAPWKKADVVGLFTAAIYAVSWSSAARWPDILRRSYRPRRNLLHHRIDTHGRVVSASYARSYILQLIPLGVKRDLKYFLALLQESNAWFSSFRRIFFLVRNHSPRFSVDLRKLYTYAIIQKNLPCAILSLVKI